MNPCELEINIKEKASKKQLDFHNNIKFCRFVT